MEATEKIVSEQNGPIEDEHLTEDQRKVLEALRQMNVNHYCPPARQIAQRTELNMWAVKRTLKELCDLGLAVLRVDASTGDQSYRICRPEEYTDRNRFVINDAINREDSVSPNQDQPSTGAVSPKTAKVAAEVLEEAVGQKIRACSKCDFVTKSYAGLRIHIGQKHKTAADIRNKVKQQELKAKKKEHAPDPPHAAPLVMIILTADEALDTGIALALADLISIDRFKDAHKISNKILRAIIKQVPQKDLEEAS